MDRGPVSARLFLSGNTQVVAMLGSEIGLGRLRRCESACRHLAKVTPDEATKSELTKLADTFFRAMEKRQAAMQQDRVRN